LYEKGDIPENGRVYVAYEPKLLPDKERLWSGSLWLFVSGDQAPKECACAFFEESVRTGELLNSVRKIYEYYEDWEEDLKKIRMDQGKIDGLLQASLSVFGNPLMVLWADFSLYSLASSTPLPKEYRVFEQGKGRMDYINAFLCGGVLCAIGQILIDKTQLTPARILTGYVVAGVILSAAGLYEPLAQWGGAGASVPLTGFGHLLAKGVRKAVDMDGWLGVLTGGLTAAAGGVTAAVFFAAVMAAAFKPSGKR